MDLHAGAGGWNSTRCTDSPSGEKSRTSEACLLLRLKLTGRQSAGQSAGQHQLRPRQKSAPLHIDFDVIPAPQAGFVGTLCGNPSEQVI